MTYGMVGRWHNRSSFIRCGGAVDGTSTGRCGQRLDGVGAAGLGPASSSAHYLQLPLSGAGACSCCRVEWLGIAPCEHRGLLRWALHWFGAGYLSSARLV